MHRSGKRRILVYQDVEIIEMEAEALEGGLRGFFGLIEEMPIEVLKKEFNG